MNETGRPDSGQLLRSRGWQVPAYSPPADRQELVAQRILLRHGVSPDLDALLLMTCELLDENQGLAL